MDAPITATATRPAARPRRRPRSGSSRCSATRAASGRCAAASPRCGSASGRRPATASSPAPARSTAGRSSATRRTRTSSAAASAKSTPTRSSALLRMAGDAGAPVVGFVRSGGARLQEGHAALAGYGRIFRASVELSRKVPQISILSGISAGGGAYSPALTDFVVMTAESRMFLTGPKVVAEAMGEEISMEDLGGPKLHGRNGVCHLVADDAADAVAADPPPARPAAAADRRAAAAAAPVGRPRRPRPRRSSSPTEQRKVYDVRDVAARDPRRGQLPRDLAALGAEHGHRLRPPRRPPGRPDRQPAAPTRRRDRRRRLGEGGALRRLLRPLPACRCSSSSTPPASCPASAQEEAGGDPPRRLAAARLRRRHACRR